MATWVRLKSNLSQFTISDDPILNESQSIDLGEVFVNINFDLVTDWYEHDGKIYLTHLNDIEYKIFYGTTDEVEKQIRKGTITNLFKTS
jgi:hypothetical protein